MRDTALVELRIRNTENVRDKLVEISFWLPEQLKPGVFWGVLGKSVQCNTWFGLSDRFELHSDYVRIRAGNGRDKTKGRSLDVMSTIKKSIVVNAAFLFSAPALIFAMAKVNFDAQYALYRDVKGLK